MKKSRLNYSIINSFVGVAAQLSTMLLGFILQTVFIRTLGATYLGLRGLYSNILQVLSFAELGIGTAVTFSLYKPLYDDNKDEIILIMNFFRKAYVWIGIIIGILGSLFIPFIPMFTHSSVKGVYLYYILFLINTVISYFFTYKRTILTADQQDYINVNNQLLFKLIQVVLQIIVLFVFKSFLWFCIIQIICTLASNIAITIKVNEKYPYLKNIHRIKRKLPHKDLKDIFHNTLGTVGSKIGDIAVNGTNSAFISYFCGLYMSGIFSNYNVIINSLINIIGQVFYSIVSSVGNLVVEIKDSEYQHDIFEKIFFIIFFCTFIFSICFLSVVNPFISFWVGSKYQLDFLIIFMLAFNLILNSLRKAFSVFISAYGLYPRDGKRAIVEAIVNLISSLIYLIVFHMGLYGVILGNITSNLVVNWYEPYIVFKYGLKQKKQLRNFYFKFIVYLIMDIVFMLLIYKICSFIVINNIFIEVIIKSLISLTLSLVIFIVIFARNRYFKYILEVLNKFKR